MVYARPKDGVAPDRLNGREVSDRSLNLSAIFFTMWRAERIAGAASLRLKHRLPLIVYGDSRT